jgi:hypothetical protein
MDSKQNCFNFKNIWNTIGSLGLKGEILCQIPIFAKIMNEFYMQSLFGSLHLDFLINSWLIMATIHYP